MLSLTLLPARAQIEGAVMPGEVIEGHAKLEGECKNCHVRFQKAAQDRLCLDCHKEVAADVASKRGMHGRIRIDSCRSCHTEHKVRKAAIAAFDARKFDHSRTDFELKQAHAKVECASCHLPGRKYREAPSECVGCHRKDDKHKGSLGPKCESCHFQANWKEVKFNHDDTRFRLLDKHQSVDCKACHKADDFKQAPMECLGCHRKDDPHKGSLGPKCENCHSAAGWKLFTFNHDVATKFPLRGAHRPPLKCDACHVANDFRKKVGTTCFACHARDDKHSGTLGNACESCHAEDSWKKAKFDHAKTRFALEGKHRPLECKACHASNTAFKDTPMECVACHVKDDTHKGRYGKACETCHTAVQWKDIRFRHDRDTKFVLRGMHAKTQCDKCHGGDLYRDKASSACYACHAKDDKHEKQVGERCESCHGEDDWKKAGRFDHGRTGFPLVGAHAPLECKACHASLRYKDARTACVSCHQKDDRHKGSLGPKCGECHNARDWRAWDYNHDLRTRFPLEGAHKPLRCEACHKAFVKSDPKLPMACVACHERDDMHEGLFGRQCERCHYTTEFKRIKPGQGRGARQ